jgi:hypothetical protein
MWSLIALIAGKPAPTGIYGDIDLVNNTENCGRFYG